ncbi:Hint domain-containing protein [Pseudooceanicola onchidii]|uniref:Hint domain-containing protein n=1 Tax=Pseudooceanicola onchidii TaxID=2562279 RepID=UPI0010AA66B9|nr:Hint domain-containing protein [Pseudooceanicola onchidii]
MARNVNWDESSTVTTGDATYDSVTGTYTLTPDQTFQAGLVSTTTAYSINYDFSFSYEAFYGYNDSGADGLTWMFHNDPNGSNITPTSGGEYFGTDHVQNAFVLEFDTFQNAGDATYDHVQLRAQSDAGGAFSSSYLASPNIQLGSGNIEDGAWHLVEISWTAATNTLSVSFDNVLLGQAVFDAGDANGDGYSEQDLYDVLGGDRVFFAMSGATGGSTNEQAVRSVAMEGTICFLRGTRILTPDGEVPVHKLKIGDMVVTHDGGVQPIRWIGCSAATATGKLAPIRFAPGTVGNHSALMVSPQHRLYVTGWQAELFMGEEDCLVPAYGFVNDRTVRRIADGRDIEYWHILFDRHEVIFANGAPAESLLPGNIAMAALSDDLREEILTLFPTLPVQHMDPARPMVPNRLAHAFAHDDRPVTIA